jgi:epoxyqueuosine reductase
VTTEELSLWIKEKALEIGFSKAGIANVAPFVAETARLEAWVKGGFNGLMGYMERSMDRRMDVQNILPNAKSILSLALNYYTPSKHTEENPKISRYAWGTDYHEVIPPMLAKLLEAIQEVRPETSGRYYVDTGPVFEKAIAERAGIGWIGKHTNVITKEFGSWVFLAEIILDLELIADTPAEDFCGTCTKCLDACPTDAITAVYQVDATRCISYLTIELKPEHEIPADRRSEMEGWLYGCDICQDVCPWNSFEQPTILEAFAPRPGVLKLTLEDVEAMEPAEFTERFRKSPIKRTKLAGLKRNAKVLLENRSDTNL